MGEAAGTAPEGTTSASDGLVVRVVDLPPEATLDAPELDALGFRPLASCAIGPAGVEPVPTRLYVARYGDAVAFADPLDADVRLRVLSVTSSGQLIETRVPQGKPTSGDPIDGLVTRVGRARLAVRYPDRGRLGVHRQLVDIDDLGTLWVSHRGFVRKVQGQDDVPDHASLELFEKVMRRAWAARVAVDRPETARVDRVVAWTRGFLLLLPVLVGVVIGGLSPWVAALALGGPALLALLARDAAQSPAWRPWLLLVPVATLILGGITLGMALAIVTLGWDLGVLLLADLKLPALVQQAHRAVLGDGRLPPPTPF